LTELSTRRYRSVFISDVHLGTRGCQAELLLDFIRHLDCEALYLVGDIVDGWKLKSGWFWPQAHNDVVQKILRMARKGVAVTYIPGNHDDRVRDFCGAHFGGVMVARDAIHQTADGRRFLITHGDEFDGVVQHAKWLAFLGDWAYRTVLAATDELLDTYELSDTTWDALGEQFDKRQRMDFVFTIGCYVTVSMALKTFGVELEQER